MYHEYTQEELRSYCKSNIESLEIWARRLIHEQMLTEYGLNYIDVKVSEDEYLIKKDIRNHINTMLAKEPGRFKRPVDTLFTEHIIYFLFYSNLFFKSSIISIRLFHLTIITLNVTIFWGDTYYEKTFFNIYSLNYDIINPSKSSLGHCWDCLLVKDCKTMI